MAIRVKKQQLILATYIAPPSALSPLPPLLVELNHYGEPLSSMAHPHLCSFALQEMIIHSAFRDLLSYFQRNLAMYMAPLVFLQ